MKTSGVSRSQLLRGTMLAGLGAALLAGPSWAQTAPTQPEPGSAAAETERPLPGVAEPNSDDQAAGQAVDQSEANQDAAEVEAVVVTGSRIRRDPTNAPAPLIQLNREEFIQTAQPNIIDVLADVPALQGSTVPEDTVGPLNQGGLSLLNLRNLGSVRTLTLVDGRRHVGAPQGSLSVDVDTIPRLLIENVEIVTGGQSALYGADAVSGVVNFILRRDFEGVEIDANYGQINQNGESVRRLSGLVGKNFLNDRLNVYLHAEYEESDEVRDINIDYLREANILLNNDTDPGAGQGDNQLDNILISNARNLNRPFGGILVLSSQIAPSPASDPDIPVQNCANASPGVFSTAFANCFSPEPQNSFVFNADGSARRPNFGTFRDQNGYVRTINVGGDGRNPNTDTAQGSRLPEQKAQRYQTGFNFDVTDAIQAFGEFKYVKEETAFEAQPTFFDIIIQPVGTANTPGGRQPDFFSPAVAGSGNAFQIGLDNAYLLQLNPQVQRAIATNTRQRIDPVTGTVTPGVADPRARLSIFGEPRLQFNEREVSRYVLGVRGDRDRLGFINNFSYEASYTYGRSENQNEEVGIDIIRFGNQADAVIDTAGVVNGRPGETVCRVQLLAAQGTPALNPISNGLGVLGGVDLRGLQRTATTVTIAGQTRVIPADTPYDRNDPIVRDCAPANIFGFERLEGAAKAYSQASIFVTSENEQRDFLAFASGELFDPFRAGPVGVALGYEYREERAVGTGRSTSTGNRLLFLNTGDDFPDVSYDTNELFAEVSVPLLRDSRLGHRAEISGAYRYSDISTIGGVETYSVQFQYRPVRDILFRATGGRAVRVPNLSENFAGATQTFANGLADPCDPVNGIRNQPDPVIRANREANCRALLGANFDRNPDGSERRLLYTSGVPGRNTGNPDLTEEQSRSYTLGLTFTPRFARTLGFSLDYYNIKVTDVISQVTAQTAINQCVGGAAPNVEACSTFTRDPVSLLVNDFVQRSTNFAAFTAQGMDFTGRYSLETADVFGRDLGRLSYSIRGNYLIRQEDFTNINDPSDRTEFDAGIGLPRVRFKSDLTYAPVDRVSVTWSWDYQTSQEIADSDLLLQDPDNRPAEFLETGSFSQHDFIARYDVTDQVSVRAGVVNAFDAEPPTFIQGGALGVDASSDIFDLFGRRYFVGLNVRLGAAAR